MTRISGPTVHIGKAWRLLIVDLGLSRETVLKLAGLPLSVLDGQGTRVPLDDFYRLCAVVTDEVDDPEVPLRTGQVAAMEFFDPAFFAAICSPHMNAAAQRLGEFKRLVGAFSLDLTVTAKRTRIDFRCKYRPDVPRAVGTAEIVFLLAFARRATRHRITAQKVRLPDELGAAKAAYEAWFGCEAAKGPPSLTLAAEDARRPFLTHDEEMWNTFEPALRRRMEDARGEQSTRARVERALFELLPSGRARATEVARELGMSSRSLQRRLSEEGTTWLEVLNDTRERLARHYLSSTEMNPAEVSFLLGFEDPNSLFRAFHRWTGTTPAAWRAAHRQRVEATA